MILILTEPSDAHADAVCRILEARQYPYVRLDSASFPARIRISAHISGARAQLNLREITHSSNIDLSSIGTVWYRRPGRPVSEPILSGREYREGIEEENH